MWTVPAPTGHPMQDLAYTIEVVTRNSRLVKAEATADELRDLAILLRALEKDIFQGGQNTPFVSAEAERIRLPILNGWYDPLPGLGRQQHVKQRRLFDKVCGLLGEIASGTADSPCERLESLASDVDELAPPTLTPAKTPGGERSQSRPDSRSQPTAPPAVEKEEAPRRVLKEPKPEAIAAYRIKMSLDWPQGRIGEQLTKEFKQPFPQWKVSRLLADAKKWLEAGNVFPPLLESKPATTVDPAEINKGARQDHQTPRQRHRQTTDE